MQFWNAFPTCVTHPILVLRTSYFVHQKLDNMPSSALPVELLIIVCCHAIYFGGAAGNPRDEETWALHPFQRSHGLKQGEHLTFLEHIEVAFDTARRSETQAAIIFSGGRTNPHHANLSEAKSYLDAASALKYDGCNQVLLEELATDSYQNLLFSILIFRKNFGFYPSHVKVVTHDFKSTRFRELHAKALRWPAERFEVIGINPPFLGEPCADQPSICSSSWF
jgi:hypothetical protein